MKSSFPKNTTFNPVCSAKTSVTLLKSPDIMRVTLPLLEPERALFTGALLFSSVSMELKGKLEVRLFFFFFKKRKTCWLEKVLSGYAPDTCQVFVLDKIGLKESVGQRSKRQFHLWSKWDCSSVREGCGWWSKGEAETGRAMRVGTF